MARKRYYKNGNKPSYFSDEIVKEIDHLILHNKANAALDYCKMYIKDYPDDDLGPFYLAKAHLALNNIDESLEIAKNAYETRYFHNNSARYKASLIYAEILAEKKQYNEAISILENEIERDTEVYNHRLREDYLKYLSTIEEYDRALEEVDKFIKQKDLSVYHIKKGIIFFGKSDYKSAIKELHTVKDDITQYKEQQKNYYLGRSYFELHKSSKDEYHLHKAEENLKKALTIKNYLYYCACSTLANVNVSLDKEEEAIKYAETVIDNKDKIFGDRLDDAYKTLSTINLKRGKYDISLEYLNKIKRESERDIAYLRYLLFSKQYDKYFENVYHVLSTIPERNFKVILQEYISTLLRVGKLDEALNVTECLKDEMVFPFYERVIAYIRKEKGEEPLNYRYYTSKQIANYSFEDAVNHVCEGHLNSDRRPIFSGKEEARSALLEAREAIKTLDYYPANFLNKYTIVRDDIGKDKFGKVNGMVAVVIPNTDNIITLYPVDTYISDYEDEFVSKKTKRLSQIEKFNQKYGK